jgi:hypothetical protein
MNSAAQAQMIEGEAAKVDHETENARKPATLAVSEPGGIDLHHARRAKSLQITVNTPYGGEQRE